MSSTISTFLATLFSSLLPYIAYIHLLFNVNCSILETLEAEVAMKLRLCIETTPKWCPLVWLEVRYGEVACD